MKIYDIHPVNSIKNHRHLEILSDRDEFMRVAYDVTNFEHRMIDSWKPIAIQWSQDLLKRKTVDIPPFWDNISIIPQHVVTKIGDLLEQNGELLPLESQDGDFYLYHVTNVLNNVLDIENSYVQWSSLNPSEMTDVYLYTFFKENLRDEMIFKMPLYGTDRLQPRCFATNKFKSIVEQNKITGWQFDLIWDSENPDYYNERWTRPEQWERVKQNHKQELEKKNSPTVPLPFGYTWKEIPTWDNVIKRAKSYKIEAIKLLKLHGFAIKRTSEPNVMIQAIAELVEKLRFIPEPPTGSKFNINDSSSYLSELWEEQVCKQYGWHHGVVQESSVGHTASVIVSPDQAYFFHGMFFMQSFYMDHSLQNTIVQQFHDLGDPSKRPQNTTVGSLTQVGDWLTDEALKKRRF
jgi:hypothetical protein